MLGVQSSVTAGGAQFKSDGTLRRLLLDVGLFSSVLKTLSGSFGSRTLLGLSLCENLELCPETSLNRLSNAAHQNLRNTFG